MYTPAQLETAKRQIVGQGKTFAQWADEHKFPRLMVYRILNGSLKGRFGVSHDIAVALGLKQPSH
jgi:gp16 family phage-associated protein